MTRSLFAVLGSCCLLMCCLAPWAVQAQSSSSSNAGCDICSFVVEVAEGFLKNETEDYDILGLLESACSSINGSEGSDCEKFLKDFGGIIVDTLSHGIPPAYVCQFANTCKSNGLGPCALCEAVVGELKAVGGHSYKEDEAVLKELEDLCNYDPNPTECMDFVGGVGQKLIQWMTSIVDPQTPCVNSGICLTPDVGCSVCKWMSFSAELFLHGGSYSADMNVVQKLEGLCTKLPSSQASTCSSDVANYGPFIVKSLLSGMQASTLCSDIGLCSSSVVLGAN